MKHWMSVREAAEVMGCSRRQAYRRLKSLELRLGKPVLVSRVSQGRKKIVVSAVDIARICGEDKQLADLLEIKETMDALIRWAERITPRVEALCRKAGV